MSGGQNKGASPRQRKILAYLQDHHPYDWILAQYDNRAPALALARDGLCEKRLNQGGLVEVRLTDAGRASKKGWR